MWSIEAELGLVVPIPTLPAVEIKSDEVPAAVFVPEKYATWPCVPERTDCRPRDEVAESV